MLVIDEAIKGYIAVFFCVLFFGVNSIPFKLKTVKEANVHTVIFQLYVAVAILLSSLWMLFLEIKFIWMGVAGACIWSPAAVLAYMAINKIGVAMAQSLWCGCIIVVSFLWGIVAFNEEIKHYGFTSLAIVLLITGILGISMCKQQWQINFPKPLRWLYKIPFFIPKKKDELDAFYDGDPEENKEAVELMKQKKNSLSKGTDLTLGIVYAALSGILSGTLMVPAEFVPEDQRDWDYIFSFAVGSLMCSIAMTATLVIYHFIRTRTLIEFHFKKTLAPGLLAGVLWASANLFRVFAVLWLGMAVGFPLTQLGLVIAAAIGMIFFKEITSRFSILVFVLSTICIISGAFLLSFFGRGW